MSILFKALLPQLGAFRLSNSEFNVCCSLDWFIIVDVVKALFYNKHTLQLRSLEDRPVLTLTFVYISTSYRSCRMTVFVFSYWSEYINRIEAVLTFTVCALTSGWVLNL